MVREMTEADKPRALELMYKLWPDFDGVFDFEKQKVLVWEEAGRIDGFAACAVRPWVDGAEHSPVAHLEGWYVEESERRKGKGGALVKAIEDWCVSNGYSELTSDTWLDNQMSIDVHKALGFAPTEKIQYFRK